jgi:hypothetical protein
MLFYLRKCLAPVSCPRPRKKLPRRATVLRAQFHWLASPFSLRESQIKPFLVHRSENPRACCPLPALLVLEAIRGNAATAYNGTLLYALSQIYECCFSNKNVTSLVSHLLADSQFAIRLHPNFSALEEGTNFLRSGNKPRHGTARQGPRSAPDLAHSLTFTTQGVT